MVRPRGPPVPLDVSEPPLVLITVFMLACLLLAGTVVVYVAYPHRGHDVPAAPWLSRAMRAGVSRLPTLSGSEQDRTRR